MIIFYQRATPYAEFSYIFVMDIGMENIITSIKELLLAQQADEERFAENERLIKEMFQETARRFQETDLKFQETDRKFQETDRKFQETDKRINKAFLLFEGQWGKLIESLVQGDLLRLLNERKIPVQSTTLRREGSYQGQNFEFDLIAHNGAEIVMVEVKTTLRASHVRKFLEKLKQVHTSGCQNIKTTKYTERSLTLGLRKIAGSTL